MSILDGEADAMIVVVFFWRNDGVAFFGAAGSALVV
jgi:hypothetical protein